MPTSSRDPLPTLSGDVLAGQVDKLKALFPECVGEGRVDFDRLRATLGGAADDGGRFRFSWAGKADAIRLLQTPTQATLAPAPAEGVNPDAARNVSGEGENREVLKLLLKPSDVRAELV